MKREKFKLLSRFLWLILPLVLLAGSQNVFAKKICPDPVPLPRISTIASNATPISSSTTFTTNTTNTLTNTSSSQRMIQQCYFDDMPIYDQTNPNYAYVSVPDSTYCAEKYPVHASDFADGKVCSRGIPRTLPRGVTDDFYKSWLPWGPLIGDPGSVGSAGSATCAANSDAMIMHSAVNNKSSTTTLVSGTGDIQSWVQDVFLSATRPSEQEEWPNPLINYLSNNSKFTNVIGDTNAEHRDPYRMTANDLQQVVNIGTAMG